MEACLGVEEEMDLQEVEVDPQEEAADLQEGGTQEQTQISRIFPNLPIASLARNLKSSREIAPRLTNSSHNGTYLLGSTSITLL